MAGELPRKVLVVDADAALRRVVHQLLAEHGYEVATAATGAEALELVRGGGFDLALLDLVVPDIGGVELIRRIRKLSGTLNVVVISGCAGCLEQSRLAELGVRRVLAKPCKTITLLETVHALAGNPEALARLWTGRHPRLTSDGAGAAG